MTRRSITVALICEIEGTVQKSMPPDARRHTWYRMLTRCLRECDIDTPPFSLSVILVDENRIRELNAHYRGHDWATDVLSFAYVQGGVLESGELYLCPAKAMRQRSKFHTTKKQEMARISFHGLLHIVGYDHDTRPLRIAMRAREDCLMRSARKNHLC